MTREEIDAIWQKAMHSAIKSDEPSTRYDFANLILEAASEACKTEWNGDSDSYEWSLARNECADDIRSMKV